MFSYLKKVSDDTYRHTANPQGLTSWILEDPQESHRLSPKPKVLKCCLFALIFYIESDNNEKSQKCVHETDEKSGAGGVPQVFLSPKSYFCCDY